MNFDNYFLSTDNETYWSNGLLYYTEEHCLLFVYYISRQVILVACIYRFRKQGKYNVLYCFSFNFVIFSIIVYQLPIYR